MPVTSAVASRLDAGSAMLIAIVGPTATGKSDLAVELALALGGEVINADSMQLYRGMDIGTAKLTMAERRGVPHHLLDVWDVTRTASVAEYQVPRRPPSSTTSRAAAGSRCWSAAPASTSGRPSATSSSPAPTTKIRARLESELAADGPVGALPAAAGRRPGRGGRDPALERPPDRPRARGDRAVRPPVQRHPARLRRRAPRRPDRARHRPARARPAHRRPGSTACGRPGSRPRSAAWAAGLREGRTASRALGYQQMLR